MSLSFVMLDVVYMTVVISYCVQCFLLIFYVEGLAEKVRERKYSLERAMKVNIVIKVFDLVSSFAVNLEYMGLSNTIYRL